MNFQNRLFQVASSCLVWLAVGAAWQAHAGPGRQVSKEDLPRIPPTEPQHALATFQVAQGCRLELVAAEPMVSDPVDACFDEHGRMFVAEMHGYPFSQEPTTLNPKGGGKQDAGIIRLLEDSDGDGRMDKSVVFADNISWPTSVCCYDGGLFVLAPQYLYFFKDTDGDDRADIREVVLAGFGRGNVQALANGLRWGLDNHIYFAAGRNPAELTSSGKALFSARGRDIRFDPSSRSFELVTGGQQFGHSIDDWGNRFVCSNSNHIQHVIYPQRYLARNPLLAVGSLIRDIAADGASARVFRISPPEPWRIVRQQWRAAEKGYKLVVSETGEWKFMPLDPSQQPGVVPTEYPVGYFTSATGITIYRGNAYRPAFRGNAFVGDVGGNLVHRKRLAADGVTFSASRADPGEEFIRSSDNWFRPVNFVNAPDGALYILDMYRETIEHPHSIPEEIKQHLDLQSGSERGRIYRVVDPSGSLARSERLGDLSSDQLVERLESTNGWTRATAQRLLYQRQDSSIAPDLGRLAQSSKNPSGRVHAIYALAGLDRLDETALEAALHDPHPRVREHAILLAEPYLVQTSHVQPKLISSLLALTRDEDHRVRFQLAFSLGEAASEQRVGGLARLAVDAELSSEIRTALLSSVNGVADLLSSKLLQSDRFTKQQQAAILMSELALIVGADRDPAPALRTLSAATKERVPAVIQRAVLASLGEGLGRRGATLTGLLQDRAATDQLRRQVSQLFERANQEARNESLALSDRVQAIGLLAFERSATQELAEFLLPQVPPPLQQAAVSALAQHDSAAASRLLIDSWKTYGPQTRRHVIDTMLTSKQQIASLLAAVEVGNIGRSELERDKKQLLLDHPDDGIRRRSRELFAGEIRSDRSSVVAEHRSVLELNGSVARGFDVFQRRCAVCHRVGEVGHQVAPELASVQNKSPADLLVSILDPNREAQPNFNAYNVVTYDGHVYSGIIASESENSLTLRRAEGKEDVVLRSNIEELVSTGKSLMPDGLEKDLSQQDLADVIAFVKSIGKGVRAVEPE